MTALILQNGIETDSLKCPGVRPSLRGISQTGPSQHTRAFIPVPVFRVEGIKFLILRAQET